MADGDGSRSSDDQALYDWCDAARSAYRFVLVRSAQRQLTGRRRIRAKRIRALREVAHDADSQDPRPPERRPEPATSGDAERDAAAYREQPDDATVRAYQEAQRCAIEHLVSSDPLLAVAGSHSPAGSASPPSVGGQPRGL